MGSTERALPGWTLRALLLAVLAALLSCLGGMSGSLAGTSLDSKTATAGLKEALGVGTSRSVDRLGRVDGYLKNVEVRIPMPEKLRFVEKSLRAIGQEGLVDEFVKSMNRAAEAAAPLARDVFLETIKGIGFEDALKIVHGKDHEATDYLRAGAGPRLATLFRPIVAEQLDNVGTTRSFDAMMSRASRLPFTGKSAFNLDEYVTGRALDGMFLLIGREEEKIRKDPMARTTELLKSVFGAAGESGKSKTPWWKKALPGS
ncbi:MAG TPA: DUF4197 domain-containing protein [Candidatus Polarisedimenticolia bacterium]|nr:DUF4197 domain-containing protein [Candidatus Polarisedimenticolia bacterium]